MPRYAIVDRKGGIVANVCDWSGDSDEWTPPDGLRHLGRGRRLQGWTYANGSLWRLHRPPRVYPDLPSIHRAACAEVDALLEQKLAAGVPVPGTQR